MMESVGGGQIDPTIEGPVGSEIVVEPATTRSGRVLRPATKVRDTARQLEDNSRRRHEQNNERKTNDGGDGRPMLQMLMEWFAEPRIEINGLKAVIAKQNTKTEKLHMHGQESKTQLKLTDAEGTTKLVADP